MRWYDLFSWTYDLQLEATYRPWRTAFLHALELPRGAKVLVLGCGTGQDFDRLVEAIGPEGTVVGLDLSVGMLNRARSRIARAGWTNVRVQNADLCAEWPDLAEQPFDAVVASMLFSAVPDVDGVLERAFGALRPGGQLGILDAYAETRTFQTRMVEWLAQADLSRRTWESLAEHGPVQRFVTDASPAVFGGELYWAITTRSSQTSSSS